MYDFLGDAELTTLRNDSLTLKTEMRQTKHDIEEMRQRLSQIENGDSPSPVRQASPRQSRSPRGDSGRQSRKIEETNVDDAIYQDMCMIDTEGVLAADDKPVEPLMERGECIRLSSISPEVCRGFSIQSPIRRFTKPKRPQSAPIADDDVEQIRIMEALRNIEIMYGEAMQNLDKKITNVDRKVKILYQKLLCLPCGPDALREMQEMMITIRRQQLKLEEMGDSVLRKKCAMREEAETEDSGVDIIQEIQDLVVKIQNVQADIEDISQTAARLSEEKYNRDAETHVHFFISNVMIN